MAAASSVIMIVTSACSSGGADDVPTASYEQEVIVVNDSAITELGYETPPVAVVGGVDERAGYALTAIPTGVILGDGRFLLSDRHSRQIRSYSMYGEFIEAWGRRGEGPGEFSILGWIGLAIDSTLSAWDPSLARLTFFDFDGSVLRTVQTEPIFTAQRRLDFLGYFQDGSFPLRADHLDPLSRNAYAEGESKLFVRGFRANGKFSDVLLVAEGDDRFVHSGPGRGLTITFSPIFGSRGLLTMAGGALVYGSTGTGELLFLNETGDTIAWRMLSIPRVKPTDEDVRLALAERMPRTSQMGSDEFAEGLSLAPVGEELPAFEFLIGDSNGSVWIGEHVASTVASRRWLGIDREGRILGALNLPRPWEIIAINDGFVLVVVTDDLDRPTVMLLRRISSPPPDPRRF